MLALNVRIARLERSLDLEVSRRAYPDAPGSLAARQQRLRIDRLIETIKRLRRLEHARPLRLPPPARASMRRTMPSPSVASKTRRPLSLPSPPIVGRCALPLPSPYRPLRDDEIELVSVWTPHRDAVSLIGSYQRKDFR